MNSPGPLDLPGVIDGVLTGGVSVESAEAAILQHREHYSAADSERLQDQVQEVLVRLLSDRAIDRIIDLSRLAAAAAGLTDHRLSGAVHYLAGQRLIALRQPRAAISELEQVPPLRDFCDKLAVQAHTLIIECLTQMGDFTGANDFCQKHLPLIRECGFDGYLARALRNQAQCVARLGDTVKAVEVAQRALQLRQSLTVDVSADQEVPPVSRFHEAIAEIRRDEGAFYPALQAYERARRAALDDDDLRLAALMLSEIGMTWQRAGDRKRGDEVLRHAAREAEAIGDQFFADRWLARDPTGGTQTEAEDVFNQLTRVDYILGHNRQQVDEAAAMLPGLLKVAKERNDLGLEVFVRGRLMAAYDIQERAFAAELAGREALAVATENGMRSDQMMLMLNLMNIIARHDHVERAEEMALRAIALGEELRSQAGSVELRQTITAGIITAYEYLAVLHGATTTYVDREEQREPDPARLLALSQQCRSIDLASWLSLANVAEATNEPEVIGRLMRFRAAEVAIEEESLETIPQLAASAQDLVDAREQFNAALTKHGAAAPEHTILAISDVAACLGDDDVLVDLLSVDPGATINVIGGNGVTAAALVVGWQREDRAEFIQRFERSVRRIGPILIRGEQCDERATVALKHHAALLERFQDQLLRYVSQSIKSCITQPSQIIVAAHRDLFQVPYWQLAQSFPEARISVIPTPHCVASLQQRNRGEGDPRIAFGDPTGTLMYHTRELEVLNQYGFRIAKDRSSLLGLHDAAVVHLACHGSFERRNPYRSGLLIEDASDASPWDVKNRVTVSQIVGEAHLQQCWLAVLSACETGLPRLHPASEFTSLPAAFLVAGARNVIASLWRTHDGAAALLMEEFYKYLDADERQSPSRALQAARRRLAQLEYAEVVERLGSDKFIPQHKQPFDHPVFLDAFQHYGID